jgi:hypothetical protein
MLNFLENRFIGLLDTIHRSRHDKAVRRSKTSEVLDKVEYVVNGTDSHIRLVPGYKNKLQGIVKSALEFSDEIVNQIPGSISVSETTFTSDPYVNAFFANVTDLQSVFSHSPEVQDYMADSQTDNDCCCALLCMHYTEKKVLGMELSGDVLKKDVLQDAVSFSDHRIYSPARDESETRAGLKNCLFQGLVTNSLERIVQHRLASHRLQSRHQMLSARLRRHNQSLREMDKDSRAAIDIIRAIEEIGQELRKTEEIMLETPVLTPQVLLDQVAVVLSHPEEFVQIRRFSLRLNKMGIKLSADSQQPGNDLNLTEVTIGNELPRVVALVTFPKQELIPRKAFAAL